MGFDVEQQFILRLPAVPASRLAGEIEAGHSLKDRLSFVFDSDMRHISVHFGAKTYPGKLMDLPTITESLKTTDKKTFYKTGDICQVLICKEVGGPFSCSSSSVCRRFEKRKFVFLSVKTVVVISSTFGTG